MLTTLEIGSSERKFVTNLNILLILESSETQLETHALFTEPLVGEEETWTIQVIYPDGDTDSQLLTEEALTSIHTISETIKNEDIGEKLEIPPGVEDNQEISTKQDLVNEEVKDITSIRDSTKFTQILDRDSLKTIGYVCTKCRKIYNARRNLVRHMNMECGKEPKYSCNFCDYRNHRRNDLSKHIKNKHSDQLGKLFLCK